MANKPVAVLRITNCAQCPHLKVGPTYSMDGFDTGNDWNCEKAKRSIEKFVEWRQSDKPKGLPIWCPLLPPSKPVPKKKASKR